MERIMKQRKIRDYQSYLAAKQELAALDNGSPDLSMDDYRKLKAIRDEIELFETYLPIHKRHPSAASMLEYAINYVPFTEEDAARLAAFFGCSADAFSWSGYKMPEGR